MQSASQTSTDAETYKRNALETWPRERKIRKLAYYAGCQVENCKCNGWKNQDEQSIQLCKTCSHTHDDHIKHYNAFTDTQINHLLKTALDLECLFNLFCKEEDAESKQIYFFLFKLLRKSILNMNTPTVEIHLGKPPFEEPSIIKLIVNFIFIKYGKSGENELQSMFEAGKLYLWCLNRWKFNNPTIFSKQKKVSIDENTLSAYKLNYTRWMCYCYVPSLADTLEKHDMVVIFGRSFLKLIFLMIKQELQDRFLSEKEKIPIEKRQIVWNHLPRYVFFFLFGGCLFNDFSM
jgi:histone acetyltransferase